MSGLSYTEVAEILSLIEQIDCAALTLEYGDLRISVRRGDLTVDEAEVPAEPAAAPDSVPETDLPASSEAPATTGTPAEWTAVTAPMLGTFFRRPSPDEAPFVEVGDHVEVGQPVGLIEVMKLYSELKSEVAGTVVRIDAEDAALVEFDAPLIWIEPSGVGS